MWKLPIIPEDFMVKHFSCQRYNLSEGRLHTLLTYSFSHTGLISLAFDLLMLGLIGKNIQMAMGPKCIYWLYGLGTLFGGLSTVAFQRPSAYIIPKIQPSSAIAAYLSFIAMANPHATIYFFFVPMAAWQLLALIGAYSLFFDPQKRYFSGITAGITVYQMFRFGMIRR